ncbi:MAG: single-stranded-DNA-specific exonuclease RecJ [Clostridia bacterium]|nr:single-stranded-DNA-specific exonuclease RecJ [Clostridia bacterium]
MIMFGDKKTEYDVKVIDAIARKFGLFTETAEILYNRGVRTEEDVEYFLNPGKHHFVDPFLLGGIRESVERIRYAAEAGETVIVYGDYDADGVTATTVLTFALEKSGVNVIPFVPERSDGYGLNNETIDKLIEQHYPDLIITVDCGISCYQEVEYIKSLGVDVIVTDHHELPETLPDCLIVNCKIPSDYKFSYLCGAGVAFKLACALIGESAYKYLDLVAIATIADSMPLVGENRDIVYEGVKLIKSGGASAPVNELIAVCNVKEVTSTSLAFTIAPRINAAGRMGDANAALRLLLCKDKDSIERLALKLNTFNQSRQQECETLYKNARDKLIKTAYDKKIVILKSDVWNSGLVGIIAARLVEEFSRPVILFVNNDGSLHGSARSVESINIYEAISACKSHLIDFGGHAQAAGITIDISEFDSFKRDIEKYIDETYDFSSFRSIKTVDVRLDKPFRLKLAKELSLLEPFGTGNRKPLFAVEATDLFVMPIKVGSPHLSIKTPYIDMLYFNGAPKKQLLSSGAKKSIIFEPNVSVYNHEESLKGYVKDVDYVIEPSEKITLDCFRESLLTAVQDNDDYLFISEHMAKDLVKEFSAEHFGTVFAFYNPENADKYPELKNLDRSLFLSANRNLVNNVVVGITEHSVSGYRKILYLDRPLGSVPTLDFAETFINRSERAYPYAKLNTEKQVFADVFKKIREKEYFKAETSVDFALKCDLGYHKMQVIFILEVFIELGIFYFNKGFLRFNPTIKTNLDSSKIYTEVERLKG